MKKRKTKFLDDDKNMIIFTLILFLVLRQPHYHPYLQQTQL